MSHPCSITNTPDAEPAWRRRKIPASVLLDVVHQLDRESRESALDVLNLIEQAMPGRIDGLLLRCHEAELERDARTSGYGSLAEQDAHTRERREEERAEWVEWLDAGGRDRLLAWQPAPYERPLGGERAVWLAVYPDGLDPIRPDPDAEWEVLGAGTSPAAAHRAYVADTRDRMLDPWACVPEDPRESTLCDVPADCAGEDPITALLAPHVRYVRLLGDADLVERIAQCLANGHWIDDRAETDERYRIERDARAARDARRAEEIEAARPLVEPFRVATLAAAAACEPPTPVVDGEPVLVLVQRYMRPEVGLDDCNGIEATGTDWPEVSRAAVQAFTEAQLDGLSAAELVSRYDDPALVVPAEKLERWMSTLVPLVVTGPAGVDVAALLRGCQP